MFTIPGCRVSLPIAWLITYQSYPAGCTRGAGLLGEAVGVFMVSTWLYMRYCPCRRRVQVLYLCTCGTVGIYFSFWCADGGIGSMSSVCGAHWSGRLGGYTLRGGAGEDSRVSTI